MTYIDMISIISGSEETILCADDFELIEWMEKLEVKWNETFDWLEKDE